MFYLAPDTGEWASQKIGYSGLLGMLFSDSSEGFDGDLRWSGRQAEISRLGANEAISVCPPLPFRDGGPLGDRRRSTVPIRELWTFHYDLGTQLRDLPGDGRISVRVT